MSEDFLSRWSRRKREARKEPEEEPRPALPPDEAAEPVADAAPPGEPALGEEELAALPPVDELTAESDFSAFLRKGVPEKLRNAALRRMWALDPAIRDHVGDARDYAWDWNVPGDVPGSGPLLPCDRIEDTLQRLFGDGPGPEAAGAAGAPATAVGPEEKGSPEHDARALASPTDEAEGLPLTQRSDDKAPAERTSEVKEEHQEIPSQTGRPRRHGGAKPV